MRNYALGRVAKSARKACSQSWRMWESFTIVRAEEIGWGGRYERMGTGGGPGRNYRLRLHGENEHGGDRGEEADSSERLPAAVGGIIIAAAAV